MKTSGDPIRLYRVTRPGSVLGRGLEMARMRGPTAEQLEELKQSVLVTVGAAAAVSALATIAPAAATASAKAAAAVAVPISGPAAWVSAGATKLAVAIVVTGLVSGGGVAVWHSSRPPALDRRASTKVVVRAPTPHRPISAVKAQTMVETDSETTVTTPSTTTAPTTTKLPAARRVQTTVSSLARTNQEQPAPDGGEEVRLLARARAALADDVTLALALADQHQRRFPVSALDQERELIAITALLGVDRSAEAWQRARLFAQKYPGSAYLGHIHTILDREKARRP